ncbi:uncharacterized protein LOC125579267 [Brassica napus]|uniref:uncharacterized protein LOC125579267 n=1 Tax=Brassica napus TaxID=3708 RepID=UPI002078DE68|nr:uncharacterized protein LOC125579267 [Brassica napus]
MSSSSSDEVDEALEEMVDQVVDNFIDSVIDPHPNKQKRRAYIERHREQGLNQLWNDYFQENPTYPPQMFRRRFRMNKPLFLHIVERARDTYDEYLRLANSTSRLCLENFTNAIIKLFGDEYLRSPTAEDLQRLLDVGEEKEANKKALRKYLELVEFFTKVLVALYEQNDKPSSALEFIQQKLGSPSVSDYKKLQSEKSDLQIKDNEVFAKHQGTLREVSRPNLNIKVYQ